MYDVEALAAYLLYRLNILDPRGEWLPDLITVVFDKRNLW
jgi:hypothetical protein